MSYASYDGQIRYFPPDKNIFFFYMSPYKIRVLTWKILQALTLYFQTNLFTFVPIFLSKISVRTLKYQFSRIAILNYCTKRSEHLYM